MKRWQSTLVAVAGGLFVVFLATLMVPFQVLIIPTFLIVKHLGMVDSVGGLIMPNLCTAFGIFMFARLTLKNIRDTGDKFDFTSNW